MYHLHEENGNFYFISKQPSCFFGYSEDDLQRKVNLYKEALTLPSINYEDIKEYNSNPGVFGIYMGANITAGASYAPTLQYNGGITNYVPYFTNQSANATVMWVYNATAYLQISVTEFWFN
jgi:hypothetical protein